MSMNAVGPGGYPAQAARAVWELPASLSEIEQEGDIEFMLSVISAFQEDSESRLRVLGEAVDSGDTAAVRMQAHAIKGSAREVGANELASICAEIESKVGGQCITDLEEPISRLVEQFRLVSDAMGAYRDSRVRV